MIASFDVDYGGFPLVVGVTLGDSLTTLSLAAELNPANDAEPVTVTATVDGNGTPRGSVQFTVDGVATGGEIAVVDEVARLDVGVLTHGRHTIAATYASNSGHDSSTDAIDVVVNDAPVAVADAVTVAEDAAATTVDVVGNDSDADGDTLTIDEYTQPGHGDVVCDQTSCTYTPDGDFHGTDTFTYTVSDGFATATATVTITVDPVNDPPTVTVSIEVQAVAGQATVIDVLSNAGDVDGDTLTLVGHTDAEHGELDCTPAGTCTYTPDSGYSGGDQFNYTITDGPPPAAILGRRRPVSDHTRHGHDHRRGQHDNATNHHHHHSSHDYNNATNHHHHHSSHDYNNATNHHHHHSSHDYNNATNHHHHPTTTTPTNHHHHHSSHDYNNATNHHHHHSSHDYNNATNHHHHHSPDHNNADHHHHRVADHRVADHQYAAAEQHVGDQRVADYGVADHRVADDRSAHHHESLHDQRCQRHHEVGVGGKRRTGPHDRDLDARCDGRLDELYFNIAVNIDTAVDTGADPRHHVDPRSRRQRIAAAPDGNRHR